MTLPQTLPQVVRRAAERWPNQPALIDDDRRWTFAELSAAVTQVARGFVALGLQAGDRVAIWAPNQAEWILAASGAQAAGGVVVPINTRMKGAEAADILARSRSRMLVCVGRFLDQDYPALLQGLRPASLQHLIVLPGSPAGADLPWQALLDAGASVPEAEVTARESALNGDSLADLMFTSGTTGRPKGVMASHGAVIRAFDVWAQVVGLNEGDRYLIVNPFFHSFGYKAGWMAALLRGATIVPHKVFDAESVLQRIQQERISFLPGPPTLYLTMLAHPRLREFDLSSLKGAVTGAATVPPVLIRRMREELGIARVTTAYGLTECGGCATVCDPSDGVDTIALTCGKALPGTEVICADDQGRPLPPGQPGEVLLRGYHVMLGYFEDPDATAEAISPEGWLHTGDVGVLDERGYLRITDRLKDMFIVGGFNCYPAEIERVLAEHPAIAQVAVVGMPDERLGEVGCACVVLRPGAQLAEDELVAWSRERMANYKVPRRLQLLSALPLNASGKVLKRELAAGLRAPSSEQGM